VEVFEGGHDDSARAKLAFRCIDQLGYTVVTISLVDFAYDNAQLPIMNDVNLEMRFEASALDQFCKELDGVTLATLQGFTG
jgi:hypothetical protein